MLVAGPVVRLNAVVLEVLQHCSCELGALCDNLSTRVVLNTLRSLALGECEELVDENILQVVVLCLVLLVDLGENHLVLLLRLACLDGTREELLVDNHTAERRVSLE